MIQEMNENEIAEVSGGGWTAIVAVAISIAAGAYQVGKDIGAKLSDDCPVQP